MSGACGLEHGHTVWMCRLAWHILVAKANHFWFNQSKGKPIFYHTLKWNIVLSDILFQLY